MIRINPLFFIVLSIAFVLGLSTQFLTVLTVAVLHEAAHALCAYILGCKDLVFFIQPWGVCMNCKPFDTPKHEFFVAFAGPFLNLILILVCSLLRLQDLYIANLFMLIINLLPVYPLDGGRILYTMLKTEFSVRTTRIILKFVSAFIIVIMFVAGCFLLYKTGVNFSVLIASLFLCLCSDKNDAEQSDDVIKKSVHYSVSCEQNVKCALKHKHSKNTVVFDVTDISERYLGSVTYKEVLEEIANSGYEIKFGEILEKQLLYREFCSTI